jgi:hypothetical protein
MSIKVLENGPGNFTRSVLVHIQPRSGEKCISNRSCVVVNATTNRNFVSRNTYKPITFTWYNFKVEVPISYGVSAIYVETVDNGVSILADNRGNGFQFSDTVLPQLQLSCTKRAVTGVITWLLNSTVAVSYLYKLTCLTLALTRSASVSGPRQRSDQLSDSH